MKKRFTGIKRAVGEYQACAYIEEPCAIYCNRRTGEVWADEIDSPAVIGERIDEKVIDTYGKISQKNIKLFMINAINYPKCGVDLDNYLNPLYNGYVTIDEATIHASGDDVTVDYIHVCNIDGQAHDEWIDTESFPCIDDDIFDKIVTNKLNKFSARFYKNFNTGKITTKILREWI